MKQRLRRPLAMLLTIVMLLGLLPTAAFAVEDETGAVGETKITKMTLQNFKPFGEDAVEDVDLLNQSDPLSWEATGSNTVYTINFTVELEGGVPDKSLRITLPYGMQFVGLVEENGQVTNIGSTTIESVEWEHSVPVYENSSNSNYQRNNGTLIVHFPDEGASSSSFSINVQPDVAFLPTDQKDGGFLIEDAIQAQVQVGGHTSEPESVDVKLFAVNGIITSNGGWNKSYSVVAGTSDNKASVTVYWQYLFPDGGGAISYFMDKAVLIYAVPNVFTITDASMSGAAIQEISVSNDLQGKYPDCKFYSATYKNFYGAQSPFTLTFSVDQSAETDKTYIIYPISTEVTAYGQDSSSIYSFDKDDATNQVKIKVIDPKKTYLEMKVPSITLTNYTGLGNEAGNFDDYNMLLSYVEITNSGADNTGPLIYEARFDSDPDLIRTAIRIPCQADSGEYPTELTIYYGNGQSTTLDGEAIQGIATILNKEATYSGIEIQLADVTGLPAGAQVTGFKAQISGLNKGYENGKAVQERYTSAVIGRIAAGVEHNTPFTDNYRVYSATASEGDIPEYTKVPITISNTPGQIASTSNSNMTPKVQVNGETQTTAQPGDTIQISDIGITPTSYYGATRNMLVVDPIFYIIEPAGLNLSSVSFTDGDGNPVYATKTEVNPTNGVEIAYGGKLYAYQLNNTLSGYWDGDMEARSIQAKVEYNVPYGVQTAAYDLNNLMFWVSGISGTSFNTNFPYAGDLYDLNNGKYLGGYKSQIFSVTAPQDLAISSAMQIDGTDEWFVYDGTDSSLAVFGNNTTATVQVTIRNNTSGTLNSVEVYVPIPKTGKNLGTNFGPADGYNFDMHVADSATVPDNWKVEYGVVENAPSDKQTAPISKDGWSTSYSDDTNMVKISMTTENGLPTGEAVDIDLKLRATIDASQNDKRNLFKSWYSYEAASGSGYDASEVINFGALLQIGELTGTVYADSDRDSTKGAEEQGVENVRVTVTDKNGRVYEDRTDDSGQYTISGLPSNQELTVTVYNPYSHENRAGARRFSANNPSTTGTIGSDVTSTDSGQTGTITLTSLTGGKGVVNAGLVQPYHVQFKLDKTSDTGYVTPAELYVFPGQTLSDVTDRITVVTPAGQDFLNQWEKSVDSTTSTVENSALLNEEVTADTIYTAQTQTRQSTVNATWWDAEAGTLTKKQSWTVEFGQNVPSTGNTPFPTDDAVNVRPGYDFKGWEVNGDSTNLKQRKDIIEEPVYAGVNYVAHYEPKTDISVTLDANGGTFAGGSNTLTLSDLTYGGVVNNAVGYKAPTREDHYFVGWADEMSAGSGTETLMVPTESKTYYAVWAEGEPENVTVSFDRMGGEWTESGASSFTTPLTGKPGTSLTLPDSDDITRTGYDFGGWYTDYDCSEPATNAFPSSTATWYAKWVPHKHTVTYNYNGGKVDGSEETKKVVENLDYDSLLIDIPAPQKPGYELIGWRITTEGRTDTGYIIPSANMTGRTVDGDITYKAYYVERPITVTFNANRYDSSGPAQFGDGTTQKLYQNILGEEMPFTDVPVPTREGYVFVGWEDDDGTLQSGNLIFTEATDYYASWEEATFTVTYRLNGGTVNGDADDISTKVTYKGNRPSAPAVTLPGSTLAYWLDMSTGNKYAAQANPEEDILAFPTSGVTSDEVYLAIWNTNQYTVTFTHYDYSQDGEGYGDSSQREVPTIYNGTPAAPAVVPPAGQAFDHWLMTAPTEGINGQTEFTANELLALKVTQDMTFQAVFKATDYTVTFDANGGQFAGGSVPTYSVAYNAALSTAEDFAAPTVTKTGSEFRGWTKTGDDTLYTNNAQDGNYIGKAVITSDTVFIASWSGDVRVTFNANGGTISGADYAEGQAGTAISSAPTPTRYGYTFGGWYTDSACEGSAAGSDGTYKFPAANATWYAKWTAKDVTVVFDYGEGKAGNEEQKQITKPFGSTLSEDDIPAPTLAGSTLTGWSREDGTIIPNSNMTSEVIGTEDKVTYTAYYTANPITITFYPNGGTFPDGTTESKFYMKSEGDTMPFADVPVPTKDAQTFAGWKLQGVEDSSATTTGSMTFDTAKTYVAVWTDAEYTITFRLNGGTVDGNAADVVKNANHGDTFPTPPNVTLSGNTLQGWLNMADGKMYGGSNQVFPTNVTESATYIAIWGANTYDVTFTKYNYSNQDTGDSSTLTIPTIYRGIPAAPTVTPPTGRQFTGWKITSGSLQGPNGRLDSNSAAITSAELTQCKVIGAVTLEAQYSDPTYTVTFNPGEGAQLSGNAAYQVTNGKTMADMNLTVPIASKDGATSTSWICSLNGKAMTADEIEKLVINRDVTFTAVWVGDVTVSFVLNGGTITNGAAASVTGAPGTKVTVPLVEQDGYTFEGWYDAETGGNPVTFKDNKTTIGDTSVTYYARWTQNSLTVEPAKQSTTYTGIPAVLTWTVKDQQAGSTLTADDYDVTYFNQETGVVTVNEVPTEAGTYTVTFRGKGSYLGKTATATYAIEQAVLSSATVTVTDNSKTYNGSEQYASVAVTLNGTALIMGQDFTVTYDGNCMDAGSYSIIVTGIDNYKGEVTPTEQLTIAPKELQNGMIQAIPPQYYTGQEITPEITVHDGELVLHEGTDFENLAYSNNSEVGTASVAITGKGNYTGTATATFSIIAKSTYLEVSVNPASATYGDDLSGMTITVTANGTILTEYEDYQLSYQRYNQDGQPEEVSGINEAGVYIITATGEGNYDGSKGSTVFILYPQDESDGMLVIGQGNIEVEYDGQNHLPAGFTVRWNDGSGALVDLTDADYELLYSYNNSVPMELVTADTAFINVGIYVVTVKATGNYDGVATFVVTITPKDIASPDVDMFIDETTYNAGEQTADITVTDGSETLTEDVDYTVSNATYTDANEDGYEVLITGKGNYTGSRTGLFIIHRAEIAVTTDAVSITYGDPLPDISTVIPSVSGIYDADAAGVTVTLAWPTDLSAGTHELTASLSGDRSSNYVVDASGALLIVSAKDMNGADSGVNATLDPDYGYYTGSPLTPNVVVTDSKLGTTLTEGRDYTVSYEDSNGNSISQLIDLGSYIVIVTGKGNYTGTFELVYTIKDRPSGGGGGGGGTTRYIIEAEAGRGGDISPDGRVSVSSGSDKTFRITADEGYEIADVIVDGESVGAVSSYTFENVRKNHTISVTFTEDEPVADPDDTGVSGWLNTSDHIQYLSGYGGGKFGPTDNMTRAQAAQMFYNLLLDQDVPITVSFTDVAADAWYAKAVNTLASLGIVDGIGDNHYAPERAITRAEFTVIAMRFAELDTSGENIFSDVTADAWYYDYVVGSIQYGWINGYEDGTFRPNNTITRSEVTAIVNRMLGRSADKVFVDRHADELTQFSDVPGSYWAYYEIMEAANAHDYVKDNGVEDWTRLQ